MRERRRQLKQAQELLQIHPAAEGQDYFTFSQAARLMGVTQIYYSKLHFDLSESTEQESSAEYYTVKEAMEKFKLTRDSVYGILQFHEIKREKHGRIVRFLKVDFDKVMGCK